MALYAYRFEDDTPVTELSVSPSSITGQIGTEVSLTITTNADTAVVESQNPSIAEVTRDSN